MIVMIMVMIMMVMMVVIALRCHEGPADSIITKIGSHENGNDSGNGDDSPEMSQRACRQHHNISNSNNNDNDDVTDTDGDMVIIMMTICFPAHDELGTCTQHRYYISIV